VTRVDLDPLNGGRWRWGIHPRIISPRQAN
jgi:hypothetical protein